MIISKTWYTELTWSQFINHELKFILELSENQLICKKVHPSSQINFKSTPKNRTLLSSAESENFGKIREK